MTSSIVTKRQKCKEIVQVCENEAVAFDGDSSLVRKGHTGLKDHKSEGSQG